MAYRIRVWAEGTIAASACGNMYVLRNYAGKALCRFCPSGSVGMQIQIGYRAHVISFDRYNVTLQVGTNKISCDRFNLTPADKP